MHFNEQRPPNVIFATWPPASPLVYANEVSRRKLSVSLYFSFKLGRSWRHRPVFATRNHYDRWECENAETDFLTRRVLIYMI